MFWEKRENSYLIPNINTSASVLMKSSHEAKYASTARVTIGNKYNANNQMKKNLVQAVAKREDGGKEEHGLNLDLTDLVWEGLATDWGCNKNYPYYITCVK